MARKPDKKKLELIQDYLERFEGYGLKTIARALHEHHPLVFKSVETARSNCRYYMGSNGDSNRKRHGLKKSKHDGEKHRQNPFRLPPSDSSEYEPYFLTNKARKLSILSDIHVPYHSIEALTAAIKYVKKFDPDTLLINGDFLDCHHCSNFDKDPEKRDFRQELKIGREMLERLTNEISPRRVIYKEGNHEERYTRYMMTKAPIVFGISDFSFEKVFGLNLKGIEFVGDKRIIHAGDLPIIHGHEYVRAVLAPVNVARGFFMKAKECVAVGHHHQTSEHTEPTIKGKIITTWSIGCLSELTPAYMPLNRWNHGFMNVELNSKGDFEVDNRRIFNGKVL